MESGPGLGWSGLNSGVFHQITPKASGVVSNTEDLHSETLLTPNAINRPGPVETTYTSYISFTTSSSCIILLSELSPR